MLLRMSIKVHKSPWHHLDKRHLTLIECYNAPSLPQLYYLPPLSDNIFIEELVQQLPASLFIPSSKVKTLDISLGQGEQI